MLSGLGGGFAILITFVFPALFVAVLLGVTFNSLSNAKIPRKLISAIAWFLVSALIASIIAYVRCNLRGASCEDLSESFYAISGAGFIAVPFLIFSYIFQNKSEALYVGWFRFVAWYVPASMAAALLVVFFVPFRVNLYGRDFFSFRNPEDLLKAGLVLAFAIVSIKILYKEFPTTKVKAKK